MAGFRRVISVADLGSGQIKTVEVSGKRVALANVNGQFFAIDDACTHAECSLGTEGFLDGSIVTCGCHGSTFDVKSGRVLSLPAPTDVSSYETKVENGDVYIKL